MNKKINLTFSILGLLAEIFYFTNSFNIWFRHLVITPKRIVEAIPQILIVAIGLILTIISMIFYKDNHKLVNILNYIAIFMLIVSTVLLFL